MIRTILITCLIALAGWWTYFLRSQFMSHELQLEARDEQIVDLNENILKHAAEIRTQRTTIEALENLLEAAKQKVKELEVSMWLLKVNHRLARVEVLDQEADNSAPPKVTTRIRFIELDEDGNPVDGGRELTIEGKTLYVEGLVIKFDDQHVESGDHLRGSSVAIFKRLYSENQAPTEGIPIDRPRMHPLPYRDDSLGDPYYEDLWEQFWDYANDPELAAEKGVRAIHGESPFIEMRQGQTYRIELRSSGGLSIRPE